VRQSKSNIESKRRKYAMVVMGMGRMGREASGGSRKKNKLRIDFKRNASMAPAHFKLSKSHKSRAVDGEWNGPLDGWTDGQWPALSRGK